MSNSLLLIKQIKVENANCVTGMTYGFPAMTHILGFVHAISREATSELTLSLGGCGIVCHEHYVHKNTPSPWSDSTFCLTRNPLSKSGKTASFVEEGRMHLNISLIVECHFDSVDIRQKGMDLQQFETWIRDRCYGHRFAGGQITSVSETELFEPSGQPDERAQAMRHKRRGLLPGFALVDRTDLLTNHLNQHPEKAVADGWLDFLALRHRWEPGINKDDLPTGSWRQVPKPSTGWLVPIAVGYRAISPLYEPGVVVRTRDPAYPFRFAESVYSIGEWVSPHRLEDLELIIWRYHADGDWYLCRNAYSKTDIMEGA